MRLVTQICPTLITQICNLFCAWNCIPGNNFFHTEHTERHGKLSTAEIAETPGRFFNAKDAEDAKARKSVTQICNLFCAGIFYPRHQSNQPYLTNV
jgi:hypothetical protein